MTVSILHISDLHRDADSKISNSALIESLRRDLDRCASEESIPYPNLLVVSGDVVYGVDGRDAAADAKLNEQYDEAYELLDECTKSFLKGNRNRVVLVPGNHDVSSSHVARALGIVSTPADD